MGHVAYLSNNFDPNTKVTSTWNLICFHVNFSYDFQNQPVEIKIVDGLSTTCNGQLDSFIYQDVSNGDVCYWLGATTSNFTEAYAKCVSEGGYPAIVADASMDNSVHAFLTSKG